MNWAAIKEAVRQAVISASGITDVQWQNNQLAGTWRQDPHVDLILRSVVSIGVDATEYEYNDTTDSLEETITGQRTFVVSVRIESESQEDDEESVGTLASTFRTRLRRTAILSALADADVALIGFESTINTDFQADDRMVSLAIVDVNFASVENDADETAVAGDYIEAVHLTGETVVDAGGTALDPQPDFYVNHGQMGAIYDLESIDNFYDDVNRVTSLTGPNGSTTMTVCGLMRADGIPGAAPSNQQCLYQVGSTNSGPLGYGYDLMCEVNGTIDFTIATPSGNVSSPSYTFVGGDVGKDILFHGTYDGSFVRLYRQGIEVGNGTAASGYIAPTHPAGHISLGAYNSSNRPYNISLIGIGSSDTTVIADPLAHLNACKAAGNLIAFPGCTHMWRMSDAPGGVTPLPALVGPLDMTWAGGRVTPFFFKYLTPDWAA